MKQYEGTVKNDQGALDAAKLNLTYCHITSPITGVVGLRLVDPGNIVHATRHQRHGRDHADPAHQRHFHGFGRSAGADFAEDARAARNCRWTPGTAS